MCVSEWVSVCVCVCVCVCVHVSTCTWAYSPTSQLKSLMDLTMMAFHPSHSRLRTQEELYFLLQQSGFADPQTYPTRASYSILETFPNSDATS